MFIRTKTHERFLEELKASHARTLDYMAEQIDYLRAQLGWQTALQALNPTDQHEVTTDSKLYMGEEEEDLRSLHEKELLSDAGLEEALEQLGFVNSVIETAPE